METGALEVEGPGKGECVELFRLYFVLYSPAQAEVTWINGRLRACAAAAMIDSPRLYSYHKCLTTEKAMYLSDTEKRSHLLD